MTDLPMSDQAPSVALDPSDSPATAPDPREDFQGWASWREEQVSVELRARGLSPAESATVVPALLERCHAEIDAMADELGIPVAPLDPAHAEVAERLIAFQTAIATMLQHAETCEQTRWLLESGQLEALRDLIAERAEAIRGGELADPAVRFAEARARGELACRYERRSRGEPSYRAFASALRRRRFEPSLRRRPSAMPVPRPRAAGQARMRERRVRARAHPSRGDPAAAGEDGDPDPDRPGSGKPLRLLLPDGLVVEIPAAQVGVVECALRRWRQASRRSADLADQIQAFLREHPGETTSAIARGVKRRTADVRTSLANDGRFQRLPASPRQPTNARCWGLAHEPSALVPEPGTSTSAARPRLAEPGGERR